MPTKLWAKAVHTAVYVLNRTGTNSISGKNPHELWHSRTANKLEYRIFGTETFTHVPKQKRTKWEAKAKKGVFVGYDENIKGFRVYFATENKIEIHRDVKFLLEKKTEITIEPETKDKIDLPQEPEDSEKEEGLKEKQQKEQEYIEQNQQPDEQQENTANQESESKKELNNREDNQQPKKEERKLRNQESESEEELNSQQDNQQPKKEERKLRDKASGNHLNTRNLY